MSSSYSKRRIWSVTAPILLSLLAQNIINLTDTIFLGHVGETELAAAAIASILYIVVYMLGFGFSLGAQVIIARRNGEGSYGAIGGTFYNGLGFVIAMAVAAYLLFNTLVYPLLSYSIDSKPIYSAVKSYMDIRMWGVLFAFANTMFRAFFVGITNTKILTITALITAVVNVVLDYVLVFGIGIFPKMGIEGAALASFITEIVLTLSFILYIVLKVDRSKFNLNRLPSFCIKEIKRLFAISSWTMLHQFISIFTWFGFFMAVENLGERALAISNIIRSLSIFTFIPASAFSSAVNSLVSNEIGKNRIDDIPALIKRTSLMSLMFVLPFSLFMFLFPSTVISMFTDNLEIIVQTIAPLRVFLGASLLMAVALVLFNAVVGMGDTKRSFIIEIYCILIYSIYVGYVVVYEQAPIVLCWSSEYIYCTALGLFSLAYIKRGSWKSSVI